MAPDAPIAGIVDMDSMRSMVRLPATPETR